VPNRAAAASMVCVNDAAPSAVDSDPGTGAARRSLGLSRGRNLGVLALAAMAPIWGYSWVASKMALDYCRPFTYVAISTVACVACLFVVLAVTGRSLRPPPLGWTVLIALLQTSLFASLVTIALTSGGAGKVSVLAYTMPFWLLLLAWTFLGERLRGLQWPAVALAFAGLVLVVRPWDIGGALSGVLACAGGLSWAAGAMVVKLLQRRTQVDAISLTAWQMGIGGLPLIAAALLTHSGWPVWSGTFVWTLAYSALLSNAVCWVLWAYALHSLPAGAAGIGTLAIPVVGVIAAWIQLGEAPALLEGMGMTLIIVALAVLAARGLLAVRRGAVTAGQQPEPELLPVID
jgi:drug/metabolite transporter (DMT)-like permease